MTRRLQQHSHGPTPPPPHPIPPLFRGLLLTGSRRGLVVRSRSVVVELRAPSPGDRVAWAAGIASASSSFGVSHSHGSFAPTRFGRGGGGE